MLLEQRCEAGRRPYIHPLFPLDGHGVLTEDSPDHHTWQHGLYTGLHGVNGSDFWFDQGENVGRIEVQPPALI
ncbi:MAG: PmoA family protein, partial [Planctomycetes bacterium]|nr:PmoA family protein [Planctomycetota bacterium]